MLYLSSMTLVYRKFLQLISWCYAFFSKRHGRMFLRALQDLGDKLGLSRKMVWKSMVSVNGGSIKLMPSQASGKKFSNLVLLQFIVSFRKWFGNLCDIHVGILLIVASREVRALDPCNPLSFSFVDISLRLCGSPVICAQVSKSQCQCCPSRAPPRQSPPLSSMTVWTGPTMPAPQYLAVILGATSADISLPSCCVPLLP